MQTAEVVLELKNVSKTFHIREKKDYSIRHKVLNLFNRYATTKKIEALKDINITVKKGSFIGLIGHNGSGKTTLLRIILGAIKPDKGSEVVSKGRILRLSLGLGFDPNLSARHNIYVNGSIMGLTFKEIGAKFDEILSFAELEEFVDTPLKYYSSGMYSRLAFAIAMHAKADILLIDEFFGTVGDESFRQKSEKYFHEKILHDKTVIFVTHNLDLIEKFCDEVYVLKGGAIVSSGTAKETIVNYLQDFIA